MKQSVKLLTLAIVSMFVTVASFAQVTTSSMSGKITEADGTTVVGATVVAIHTPSGTQYYSVTDNSGYYRIQNMKPGGPYSIEVSLLGFGTNTQKGITISLAENYVHNVKLSEEAIALDELVVSADAATSTMNSERAGSVTSLNMAQMAAVPTVSRDLEGFVKLTPQSFNSGNGPQIGGGTYRENNFTIDGAAMNNAFGIGQSMPAGGSPISLDAIDQISINVTPFDVRQSGFLGGSMNATTRSGSNEFKGSAYMYFYNEDFRGAKTKKGTLTLSDETNLVYGFTVGGPIVKDKLFFFVNAEIEKETAPGPARIASNGTNYTDGSDNIARPKAEVLEALSGYLADKYGYSTGAYQGYSSDSPGYKVLARLDWNIHKNHKLSLRYNTTNKKRPSNPSTSTSGLADRYWLDGNRTNMSAIYFQNARYFQEQNYHSFAGELNSSFANGTLNNLLRVAFSHQDEPRSTEGGSLPFVDIGVEKKYYTSFGTELFSYGNLRDVKTLTVTDELTWSKGINLFTFGLQYEHNRTKNGFQRFGAGYYTFNFDSEQDLLNAINNGTVFNNPHQYAITHSFNDDFSQAFPTFDFNQFSIYLQDELTLSDRFKLTAGLRFEIPMYPDLNTYNEAIHNVPMADYTGDILDRGRTNVHRLYDTSQLPATTLMVSPRVGFNWDVLGNRKFIVRGGTGLFTGRLPFVWIVAQAGDANVLQTTYTAVEGSGKVIPSFTGNREQDLAQIYPNGVGSAAAALPSSCALMAPDLKMPQTWKSSLAADVKLPGGIIGTIEGIYNYDVNPVKVDNVALKDPKMETNGTNDNRYIWGAGVKNTYADAYHKTMYNAYLLRNAEKNGRYFSLTAKLEKSYWRGLNAMVAYTYSNAKSLSDGFGDQIGSAWTNTYTVNGNNFEELAAPSYVMPHRIIANVSYGINYGKNFRTSVSLFYEGGPQGRVSYTYTGSVVNDGGAANLIYVPKSKDELEFSNYTYTDAAGVKQTYAAADQAEDFWNFVNNNKYLKTRKGQYAERNGLVYPWVHQFDLKITQDFYLTTKNGSKNTLSLGLDIKNLGNLLNKNWGAKQSFTVASILKQTNRRLKDGVQKPVYQFQRYGTEVLKDAFAPTFGTSSTYLMQFTVRYSFN